MVVRSAFSIRSPRVRPAREWFAQNRARLQIASFLVDQEQAIVVIEMEFHWPVLPQTGLPSLARQASDLFRFAEQGAHFVARRSEAQPPNRARPCIFLPPQLESTRFRHTPFVKRKAES